ncbi:Hsp20/alpha crystallin family protein [Achromobacter denitrificans]|uniref:Hsp20/alpha crystallin family protein n=1 Tax=Achromobacter TaxID=222 RepID=UPI00240D22DA|nr:Hsp20/alpha crystallin family protein [Achromobacter denitrificans]MBV2160112.1 Hsp20/alpha crystallin family protein [Achromobacter denitrificans]MDX3877100.1 Hsp20/alpha crystallin family protein [Achromobacter sp.]WFC68594.1 Hsp20/alpha crystallin family protein [Achromobacter denitrificans]
MNEQKDLTVPAQEAASDKRDTRGVTTPAVDIFEDPQGISLIADLPGVSKERLRINVESDVLLIEGEAAVSAPAGLRLVHGELRAPLFRRSFRLGQEFDRGEISASLKQGVLTLRIPRVREAQPRQIPVQAG